MDNMEEFVVAVKNLGVVFDAFEMKKIPGRGTGMIATRTIKAKETILSVPITAGRTIHSIRPDIISAMSPDATLHSMLTVDLMLNPTPFLSTWLTQMPTQSSLSSSFPICWPTHLQSHLPTGCLQLLKKQQSRLKTDFETAHSAFPSLTTSSFLHPWLLINSRSFYLLDAQMQRFQTDDRLALFPLADMFNHASTGLDTDFNDTTYSYIADREYAVGEEIYLTYASKSNDYLLVEYGFVTGDNPTDAVSLDDLILGRLGEVQKRQLKRKDYLGDYLLFDSGEVCHRTEVAVRMVCCPFKEWRRFVDTAEKDARYDGKVGKVMRELLEEYREEIRGHLEALEKDTGMGTAEQRGVLERRWRQVDEIVGKGIESLTKGV